MKIETINLDDLQPLEKNVRKHNEKQIQELIRSLEQFGQTRAIVIDETNNILIGNGLYYAMKTRGDAKADCHRITGLSEQQKKKLVLTDNKVFQLGIDDFSVIQEYIDEITMDGDFDIAGFDEEVLQAMTRDLEQISSDVSDYGKIPEGYVRENVVQHEPVTAQQAVAATDSPVAAVQQPITSNYTPTQEQPTAAVQNDRTIICPSCGEVIHID